MNIPDISRTLSLLSYSFSESSAGRNKSPFQSLKFVSLKIRGYSANDADGKVGASGLPKLSTKLNVFLAFVLLSPLNPRIHSTAAQDGTDKNHVYESTKRTHQ